MTEIPVTGSGFSGYSRPKEAHFCPQAASDGFPTHTEAFVYLQKSGHFKFWAKLAVKTKCLEVFGAYLALFKRDVREIRVKTDKDKKICVSLMTLPLVPATGGPRPSEPHGASVWCVQSVPSAAWSSSGPSSSSLPEPAALSLGRNRRGRSARCRLCGLHALPVGPGCWAPSAGPPAIASAAPRPRQALCGSSTTAE